MSRYKPLIDLSRGSYVIFDWAQSDYCGLPGDDDVHEVLEFRTKEDADRWLSLCEQQGIEMTVQGVRELDALQELSQEFPGYGFFWSFNKGQPCGVYARRNQPPTDEEMSKGLSPMNSARTPEELREILRGNQPQKFWQ